MYSYIYIYIYINRIYIYIYIYIYIKNRYNFSSDGLNLNTFQGVLRKFLINKNQSNLFLTLVAVSISVISRHYIG